MSRINFTTISNPSRLALPAYAAGDDFNQLEAVAQAIGRRNRGYGVIGGNEEAERGGATRHRITVVRRNNEVIGSVVVELPL